MERTCKGALRMKRMKFWMIIPLTSLLIYGIYSWYYPFSTFSAMKTFSFKPKQELVVTYEQELKDFKEMRLHELIPFSGGMERAMTIFDAEWLTKETTVRLDELTDTLTRELEYLEGHLNSLIHDEFITYETRFNLSRTFDGVDYFERLIFDFYESDFYSRKKLEKRLTDFQYAIAEIFKDFKEFHISRLKDYKDAGIPME